MNWFLFFFSAAVIVLAAIQLARYGDVIALRTRLGGLFVGTLLIAGATSLPEMLTTVSSINQGVPDLAAGNLLGSNMFNMFVLALLDLLNRDQRVLRRAALKHALSGSLTLVLIGLVCFFILARIDLKIGWVGVDSLVIMLTYVAAIRLIQSGNLIPSGAADAAEEIPAGVPSLRRALLGFGAATLVLVFITPLLVRSSVGIAEETGLGATFVGSTLVALVTSLPELVTTLAAIRLGAADMAIGNLFGSNLFNMFVLGLADVFYAQGRFLGAISPDFVLIGLIGLLMTGLGLVGNLARLERRLLGVELDALLLVVMYFAGMGWLYARGLGG